MSVSSTSPEGNPTLDAPATFLPGARAADHHRARETRRRRVRLVRRGLAAVLAVAIVVAVALALRPSPVPVDVAVVSRGPLVVAIEESGVTRIKDRYVVSAPLAGNVARVQLEPGDRVQAGDTLAEIAPGVSPLLDERTRAEAQARFGAAQSAWGQARAQATRAEAAYELAGRELTRARGLAQGSSITQQALEQAEFDARVRAQDLASAKFFVKVAAEQTRLARVAMGDGREEAGVETDGRASKRAWNRHVDVLAPVSGVVLRVHQKSSGVVQPGTPLVEIGDPRVLEVVVDLLTTDAVRVRPGTKVAIKGWGADRGVAGQVRRIEPAAFTKLSALGVEEQRVNVVVDMTDPHTAWAALGDGYRVDARLVLWQADDVVRVPQGAAFRQGDGWAVFRITDGRARLWPITIGQRGESEIEVTRGLDMGSVVAVHPGDRVADGARVAAH
jgi:HlyD family secretion protein